ncbi:Phasin protein [Bradyrhizobium canariense]|uniref:Phasin protein n=1 Tax=Bradyrhizobium canariense TaxID=255045 RepID=A0A1H1MMQ6_9BRAD|nr:Phasin protein [Bradyrhizobium canariense]
MSTTHQDKSSDKPRQRNRKTGQRDQKPGRQRNPKPDPRDRDPIGSVIASNDAPTSGTAAPAEQPLIDEVEPAEVLVIDEVAAADAPPVEEVAAVDAPPIEPTAPADQSSPVDIQTIANAYRDYARKSFQENRSFVEKLRGVRSFDKAIEVQTDYARQAYANFVAESQKISALYGELAKQIFRPRKASRPS